MIKNQVRTPHLSFGLRLWKKFSIKQADLCPIFLKVPMIFWCPEIFQIRISSSQLKTGIMKNISSFQISPWTLSSSCSCWIHKIVLSFQRTNLLVCKLPLIDHRRPLFSFPPTLVLSDYVPVESRTPGSTVVKRNELCFNGNFSERCCVRRSCCFVPNRSSAIETKVN